MPKLGPRLAFVFFALILAGFKPKEDHVIAAGEGRFAIEGKEMSVHVDSKRMALYGTNFHVGPDERLNCFGAPNAQLMICSFGGEGMRIDGKVFSEVGLTLVSPAGISFGPIAEIQALQNFTAIAGRLDTADFMAGRLLCSHLDGKIFNEGKIEVGGEAIFVAGHIENIGSIAADTIAWVNGNSVYIGSDSEHMRVRLSHDKKIDAGHTPFSNGGRLTAKGRIAFRSGDPYTQAFIQSPKGTITAEQVDIDAPSKVRLSGRIDAPSIKVSRVHELHLNQLQLSGNSGLDLSGVGALICSGPLSSRFLHGEIYNEARFEELSLTEGLDLEMPQGGFFSGSFNAGQFRLNARTWTLSGDAHVRGVFDTSNTAVHLQGKDVALSSDKQLKLGQVFGEGEDLKLSSRRIDLRDRIEGIAKLYLSADALTLDQAHIEAQHIDLRAPLIIRGKSELFGQSGIQLASLRWDNEATLRLRTAGDVSAPRGIGRVGSSMGALIIEEAKHFICGGPISVSSIHHNGLGRVQIHGSVRAPQGIYLRAGEELMVAGDCNASALKGRAAPTVGAHGGFVYLESKRGDVTVYNVETNGGSGVQRGGNAGAISIFQSDALKSLGAGAYTPKAQAYLLGSRYLALGGGGAQSGANGEIKIGNSMEHFPDRCPVTFKQRATIAGGNLTFGFNTAVGFREDANLNLSGSLYLSDMLVIGDLDLKTRHVNVYPHEVGKISLSNGSLVAAAPTQIAVLGKARSSVQSIRIAPPIGYESLPINAKTYATAFAMIPERRALIKEMLELGDGLAPLPGRMLLHSMTPSIALIAPLPHLMGHPVELQVIHNEAAAPIEILADMISSSLAGFNEEDLVKWKEIESEIMQTHVNPASLPIERYQQRLRYAAFEPKRFVNMLGRSNKGRMALAFMERVKDLIEELKAQKNEKIAHYLERFSQPPQVTRQRWRQILDVVKGQVKRPNKRGLTRSNQKVHS